jgi:predicted  nucleic acid-binding Zn-ribbon protein
MAKTATAAKTAATKTTKAKPATKPALTADKYSVEAKLESLYNLQKIDSQIDQIHIVRGELPLEVEDLEDEIAGLETRLAKLEEDEKEVEKDVSGKKIAIEQANDQIKKYQAQQANVRNNREYDALTKEIEFQELEIQLCEKRIREFKAQIENKKEILDATKAKLTDRKVDLDAKKGELSEITAETEKDEESMLKKSTKAKKGVEERLLNAYERIRENARNGLAVVNVDRDACGGCFSKIPPQRQLDIKLHKKVTVCENCGRILVDFDTVEQE